MSKYGIIFLSMHLGFYVVAMDKPFQTTSLNQKIKPTSFKISFQEIHRGATYSDRRITLYLGDCYAGDVSYTIRTSANSVSTINTLHVERPYRISLGCGKILLRQAVDDILAQGSSVIELHRHPFDLQPGVDWPTRNEQLVSLARTKVRGFCAPMLRYY